MTFIGLLAAAFASIDTDTQNGNTFEATFQITNAPEPDFLDSTKNVTSERSAKAAKFDTSSVRSGTKPTKKIRSKVTTATPEVDPDDYIQPKNKFDEFDWKLSQV